MNNRYRPGGQDYLHVNDNRILRIDKEYIEKLKLLAQRDKSGKCMMCLHNDIRDHVHEMVNVYPNGVYVRPHSHPSKIETKMIIEGRLLTVIFNDMGGIQDRIVMEVGGVFTSRLDKGVIHMDIPLTDVVFHEIKTGPFTGKDDSIFPKWAPESDDKEEIKKIMDRVIPV
ncbi:hypothetical protein IMSAGC009_01381 [Lachnospiraceae bacterium]|nr:hypothetical protein IMSAGC009_01381 [Lachnospiraceae bacterium]